MINQLQRAEVLLTQKRFVEAEQMLREMIEKFPELGYAKYYLAVALLGQNKNDDAEKILQFLVTENPENPDYLQMLAEVEIEKDLYDAAEDKVRHLLKMQPEEADYFVMLSRIRYAQRNYDEALEFANQALEQDPENLPALNIKVSVSSFLGQQEGLQESVDEALRQDPENAYTIANHGMSMLNQGKTQESLDRFKEALTLDPHNTLAKHGLAEAMKSKFWPYKMLYMIGLKMSRLSGQNMWAVIIGSYILLRVLRTVASNNPSLEPFLMPIVFFIAFLFVLTWVLNPLMNLYLSRNEYGKLLLDEDDLKTSRLVGIALLASIVMLILYLFLKQSVFLYGGILFFFFMIPLSNLYNSTYSEKDEKKVAYLTYGIVGSGILGVLLMGLTGNQILIAISALGIFAFQWIINAIVIKQSGRRFN